MCRVTDCDIFLDWKEMEIAYCLDENHNGALLRLFALLYAWISGFIYSIFYALYYFGKSFFRGNCLNDYKSYYILNKAVPAADATASCCFRAFDLNSR